jgi:hypothetical protein
MEDRPESFANRARGPAFCEFRRFAPDFGSSTSHWWWTKWDASAIDVVIDANSIDAAERSGITTCARRTSWK